MANIMVNEICNLRCPYCFADEFVNKNPKEMSMEDFDTALNFALSSGYDERIGLIGGEPTLHSHFKEILIKLINDNRVKNVTIFTNGVKINEYLNEISHPKIHLLINCNSPENMGANAYKIMVDNINEMILNRYYKEKDTLGINMYKPDFYYEYILGLLKQFDLKSVRTSISVPNDLKYLANPLIYFNIMKPRVLEFFGKLKEANIIPFFDCNAMPVCIWSESERNRILQQFPQAKTKTNIFNTNVSCSPIIDILPDLTIIRCFGLSEYTKKKISDFKNIREARNYYARTIDSFACNSCHSKKCFSCYEREIGKCNGGCLCFKIKDIKKINLFCNSLYK